MEKYLFIAGTLLLTATGQLVIRWRAETHAAARGRLGPFEYLLTMFLDPFVIASLAGAVVASMFWMLAVQRMPVSVAYPFMALSFILVPWSASVFLGETVTIGQYAGIGLVVAGVAVNALAR